MKRWAIVFLMALCVRFADAQTSSVQMNPQAPTGNGVIEGVVSDEVSGEPVKGATVQLYGAGMLVASTDESGHFEFRHLPAGEYYANASAPDHVKSRIAGLSEPNAHIHLGADERKTGVTVLLTPAAAIRGRVVDEDGNPMRGCSVTAGTMGWGENGRTVVNAASANTNPNGEYSLKPAAGSYLLVARCGNEVVLPHPFLSQKELAKAPTLSYRSVFYPSAGDPAGATKVKVEPGVALTGIDFAMQPERGTLVVVSANGIDFSKSPWSAVLRPGTLSGFQDLYPSAQVDGKMWFKHVPAGNYTLEVAQNSQSPHMYAREPVQVGNAEVQSIQVNVQAAISLEGTITLSPERQRSGPPRFADLTVTKPSFETLQMAFQALDAFAFGSPATVHIQKDGTFTVENLMPGRYHVQVFGSGNVGYVRTMTLGEATVTGNLITVGPGTSGPLKITMSNDMTTVEINATGIKSDASAAVVALTQDDPQNDRRFGFGSGSRPVATFPPGEYYTCVVELGTNWGTPVYGPARQALMKKCPSVKIEGDEEQQISVPYLTQEGWEEVMRANE